jgi:hypothetical protein
MKHFHISARVFTAFVLAAFLAPAAAFAQGEGKTLEFRADLPWSRLSLRGDAKVSGVSPLRIPGPLTGDYWLTAEGRGFEKQRGRVSIRLDEEGSRIVGQGAVSPAQNMRRAFLFPGYAQVGYSEHGRAILMGATGIASLVMVGFAQDDLWDETDEKEAVESQLASATNADDRARLQRDLREAEEEESLARSQRNLYLYSTAAVWGISLADAAFFSPRFDVSAANETGLSISMHKRTRPGAIARSLLFPGLGQQYNGQSTKAFFVAAGGILGTAIFLTQHEDVLQAESEFDQVSVRAANTPLGEERDLLLEQAKLKAVERDSQARQRLWTLLGLGGFWGISLLDTALSFDEPWGSAPVGEGWRFGVRSTSLGPGIVAMRRF